MAVKSRDLAHPYAYLTIAEIYQKADQADLALEWAARGLKAFPDRPDNRLRDFLVTAYLKHRRNDEALQLTWIQFEERPMLEHYRNTTASCMRWPKNSADGRSCVNVRSRWLRRSSCGRPMKSPAGK